VSEEGVPSEIEPDLVDLVEWHTRMSVATKILSDLHSPLLWANFQKRYRVKRPEEFREIGKRLSNLTLEVIGIQDEIAHLLNAEIHEVYPEESP
jgi:hypothetical protein